jgi:flavin reductase (DIM6/NTAB) family NADH-FMN oxidoreductase RutF/pimeloyl-ACP methyl ester carboxylesterase
MTSDGFIGFGGIALAADRYGDPDAPAVLLLPGGGQTRAAWKDVATALAAAGRHVVSVDLRGHGDSGRPNDGRYDFDAFVGDLRAVLAQLSERPVIVGASLGGWIATAALGEDGAHLATGLVLIDSPPHMEPAGVERMGASMRRRGLEATDWDPRFLEGLDMAAIEPRLAAAASKLSVPTLVVRGAESPLSSAGAMQDLARSIAGAEYAEIAGARHLVATDQMDAFNAVLLDFLERRAPRAAPEYHAGSDARTLRDALGCFGTGVTVVTTLDPEGRPIGLTANSFTSVSLDPPLLLVCLARTAGSLPAFEANASFVVNVLHIGQQPTSARFARREEDRFAATPWETWDTGAPIIKNSLASFECERHAIHDGGDHVILVGRVIRVRFEPRRDPLIFFRGKYRRLHFS